MKTIIQLVLIYLVSGLGLCLTMQFHVWKKGDPSIAGKEHVLFAFLSLLVMWLPLFIYSIVECGFQNLRHNTLKRKVRKLYR